MIGLQITAKDVKASKLVKGGWYATKVIDIKNEIAGDKESEICVVELEGMEGDAEGVPARSVFSEKFPQSAVPFVIATGKAQGIEKPVDEEKGVDPRYRWDGSKNKVIYCQWGTWRGKDGTEKPRNNIVDYAPLPEGHALSSMNPTSSSTAAVGAAGFEG
jgi:hypothetical protein